MKPFQTYEKLRRIVSSGRRVYIRSTIDHLCPNNLGKSFGGSLPHPLNLHPFLQFEIIIFANHFQHEAAITQRLTSSSTEKGADSPVIAETESSFLTLSQTDTNAKIF
jgi:hypothetical protein